MVGYSQMQYYFALTVNRPVGGKLDTLAKKKRANYTEIILVAQMTTAARTAAVPRDHAADGAVTYLTVPASASAARSGFLAAASTSSADMSARPLKSRVSSL